MLSRISDDKISMVFSRALQEVNLVGESDTALIFYDISYLNERINDLISTTAQFFPCAARLDLL